MAPKSHKAVPAIVRRTMPIRYMLCAVLVAGVLPTASAAQPQLVPGSLEVHWNEGAKDCTASPQPPIQLHSYNRDTFIVRENLCATFEAPFMYLLIGSAKALLIDTGDVADPNRMPLAKTVMHLIPGEGSAKLPLLVVHTHRHLDHRAGDAQFAHLSNVQVVGFDTDSVRRYYHFDDRPNGLSPVDLGDRTVDAMPARLLIDDSGEYLASAKRVAAFVGDRPISFVLGGHIEMDTYGETFPWQSQYHPHEHVLQMTKDDLLALPAAIASFNGFYTTNGKFIMMNSMRILIVFALLAGVALIALVVLLVLFMRRRRRARRLPAAAQS